MYGILGVPGLTKDDVNTDITAQVEEATKELEGKLTDGSVTKVGTATVGGTAQPIYLSSGVPTKLSGTVGSATQPIYLSSGTITASGSTVGDTATPVYLNGGTVTKISANVGDTETPVYLKSGAVTKLSSTVGSGTKPMYMNGGTLTASSSTVGDATTPVYLNSGTLTKCTDLATALANVTPSKYVVSNGQGYFGTTTDGTEQELITCNSNNNVVVAYGNENYTNIYGGEVHLYVGGKAVVDCYASDDDPDGTNVRLNATNDIRLNATNGIYLITTQTTESAPDVYMGSSGLVRRSSSSSKRYKHDIKDIELDKVKGLYELPVVTFKYNDGYLSDDDEGNGKDLPGIIVEDLEEVLPEAVQHEDGKPEMWNYKVLVPSMLKLIQDLNERVEEQSKQIEKLETEISEIKGAM